MEYLQNQNDLLAKWREHLALKAEFSGDVVPCTLREGYLLELPTKAPIAAHLRERFPQDHQRKTMFAA